RPARVFAAVEYQRAGSLRVPAVRPPADRRLAEALSELRRAETDQRTAVLEGQPSVASSDTLARAERLVRDVSHLATGTTGSRFRPPGLTALRAALEDRVLVSYVTLDDALHAVVVEPRRTRLVPLGEAHAAEAERNHLAAAVRRALRSLMSPTPAAASHTTAVATRTGPPGATQSTAGSELGARSANPPPHALATLDTTAARLDDLLIAPLELASDTQVVIVPAAFGHGLPWATLPSLVGRGVTIAPSATLWLQPRRPRRTGRPLLVAGPDLVGAGPEVQAIGDLWASARVLTGPDATIEAVLEGFAGTDLVHISAHGTFRADSPLFSSLRLSDGPLTVFDLEGLQSAPATVVLPACSAAAVDVRVGDELIGTTAALLGVGVVSVIAPVVAVPDEATARFSVELHRHLKAGVLPAMATAKAIDAMRATDDPLARITAGCFVCVGADDRPGPDRRDATSEPEPGGMRRRSADDPRGGHRS
ncbi:MAG: CHAT domain-containing protein, partial [Aquihabitans sp.]